MTNIVERLRVEGAYMHPTAEIMNEAANEIERLRKIESLFNAALDGYSKGVVMGTTQDGTRGYISVFLEAMRAPNA